MSQIDWSKAPEGATHWDSRGNSCSVGFMKPGIRTGEWEYFFRDHWTLYGLLSREIMDSMVERPELKTWTGEGLPPIGTVCEVLWNDARKEYTTCVVVGVEPDTGCPVYRFSGKHKTNQYQSDPLKSNLYGTQVFRPIRTAEQIAADEREKEVQAMLKFYRTLSGGSESPYRFCSNLYDAGYRKQEPTQ